MKLCMGCMSQIEEQYSTCPYCGFNETALRQESYYLDPGTIVGGKYIVGRVISYGGHTISYLGLDAEAERKVIVKEYLPSDFSTRSEGEKEVTIYSGDGQKQFEQGLTNFLNEANRIQHLQNMDGIAKVYDCVAENDTGYVISEYVEGHTLKEILDSGKKYSVKEARAFIMEILKGLTEVHKMNIVHCDISPEAIMITPSGDIKLIDFGATRYVTTANSKSLSIILKRGYAPEEQYRSRGVRGPWTDVYALGAVMYRMITGIVPQESVERVLLDELKEPSKMGISLPEGVENALMNALNVYKEERTPSAEVFLKELKERNTKRIKVKKRNNKTGKFPMWAKCLVAGLACVVVIGGISLFRIKKDEDVKGPDREVVTMQDLAGLSVEKAQEKIDSLNEENGWELKLNTEKYIFDLNDDYDGRIYSQSVEPGTELSDEEEILSIDGLEMDARGKVSGIIECILYSNKKLHYSEISDLNAFAMAKKLGINTESDHFKKVKKDNKDYFALVKVETTDGTISAKELKKEKNADKEITYDKDNMVIYYYASDFFYWKSLDNFENKNIYGLPEYPTYERENESKNSRKKTGKKKSLRDTNLIDDTYCTFGNHNEGDIVHQTVPAGTKLDTSQGLDEGVLLYVIGERITYGGLTGEQVAAKIDWDGAKVQYAGSNDSSQEALSVTVTDSNGNNVDYFKKEDSITVTITTKEKPQPKPTPTPKSTPTPKPKDDDHDI